MEFKIILQLSETYRRPIGDLLEIYRRPIGDLTETFGRSDRIPRQSTCFIGDRHAPSETNMPDRRPIEHRLNILFVPSWAARFLKNVKNDRKGTFRKKNEGRAFR